MIFKLRNNEIIIENNHIPECTSNVSINYDYELGTNHLTPKLYINNSIYVGTNIRLSLDLPESYNTLDICVELLDAHGTVIRKYNTITHYYKTCVLGTPEHIDIVNRLMQLTEELQKLKDKGEVI